MANSQFAMAVHVLAMLAVNCDERVKSTYLAESVNTNAVVIRRLLRNLHEADLVVSQTGYSGGTCLTKPASEIRLDEIFRAVSRDDVFALHPNEPKNDCTIGVGITGVLGEIKLDVDTVIDEKFSSITLQEVIDRIEAK